MERLESPEPPGVIQFPWAELRRLIPYLRPGQLVTVAARPSLGKSLVAQGLARYTGLHQADPVRPVHPRAGPRRGDGPAPRRRGRRPPRAHHRQGTHRRRLVPPRRGPRDSSRNPAWSSTTPRRSRSRTSGRGCAAWPAGTPAQLAIVDYLQLMDGDVQTESRQREVAAVVGELKAIAREFRIPVVMCCQLNRGPEHRQDKRPHMSDARETGSVENDSDVAILHSPRGLL